MTFTVGIDSSTQSTKALVVDAATGSVVAQGRAPHPDATEVDPRVWLAACRDALGQATADLPGPVTGLAVGGQQHGLVALDSSGEPVRDALLWNDLRSAPQAAELVRELGEQEWARRTGSVPGPSFTVTKLAWLAQAEPELAARVARVLLPHDWLTTQLAAPGHEPTTDRGDASGTGYFAPDTGQWLPDLLERAFGRVPELPRVLGPAEAAGATPEGWTLGAGTGDNMAAALGLGAGPGDVVVSLGTSGTVFAVAERPTADPSGHVAGFCDATGRYLPLVCTLNAARVLTATATLLGVELAGLDRLALAAGPGAGGLVLLPYLDGERTPALPDAAGTLTGLRRANMTRRTWPGRPWRACCAVWPTAWPRCAGTACRCGGCCWSAARPGRRPCARSRPACSPPRSSCPSRGSTSRSAPPGRPPGWSPARRTRPSGGWPRSTARTATPTPGPRSGRRTRRPGGKYTVNR